MERLVFCPEDRSVQEHVACAEQSHPVSQDRLEEAPGRENRPVLQNLVFPWLCSSWLVPAEPLPSDAQAAAPLPWQESCEALQCGLWIEEGNASWGCRGGSDGEQGVCQTAGHSWSGSCWGTWARDTCLERRIIPASSKAGVPAASWSHRYGRKR